MALTLDEIQKDVAVIFLSYFQRAPEFEAMQHYVGVYESLLANPETADSAFTALSAQIYADGTANNEVPSGPTITDAWYVNYLYTNILGRAPDAEGAEYWTTQLETGEIARADLVGVFVASARGAEGRDADYVNNRTDVAVAFAQWENSNPNILGSLEYNAAEVLLGVNENAATVEAALDRLESVTGVVGETRNLTTGIDTIVGTTADDTFNAVFVNNAKGDKVSTLTAFDSIDGSLGTDTLNIYVAANEAELGADPAPAANATFPSNATITNIEIVNVFNGGDADSGLDGDNNAVASSLLNVANYAGIEELWQIATANDVSNATENVTVGFRNVAKLDNTVSLAAGSNIANIALENVSGGAKTDRANIAVLGASTVNVTGALNEKADDLELAITVGAGVTAVEVNTAVDTELTLLAGQKDGKIVKAIDTIDASGSTGDILLVLDTKAQSDENDLNASSLKATLGSGDDVVFFNTRTLTLRDVIDGGEGDNTLALTVEGTVQTQTYDAIALTKNFQNIAFIATTETSIDVTELNGFDTVIVAGDTTFTVNKLSSDVQLVIASDDDFKIKIGEPQQVTLLDAAADVNVALSGDLLSQLVIGNAEAKQVGDTGGELTVSGEGGLVFSNVVGQAGKFSVIDASGLEGVVGTGTEIKAILTAAGVTNLENVDLKDTVSYNAGLVLAQVDDNNKVTGAGLSSAVAETVELNIDAIDAIVIDLKSSTYGKMDTIVGFNSDAKAGDVDYLVMFGTGATDLKLTELKLSKDATTLKLAFEEAALDWKADEVVYFAFEGDTYLFADSADGVSNQYDNADFALKIVGVHELDSSWLAIDAA